MMLIYTTATSGIVMSVHYCMGDLAGISLGENTSHQCSTCGMSGQDCCHDELHIAKLDNGSFEKSDFPTMPKFSPSWVENKEHLPLKSISSTTQLERVIGLNDTGQPPIYIAICQYRI